MTEDQEFLPEQYTVLARHYDELTFDVDYDGYAKGLGLLFEKYRMPKGGSVLELACGTGSLTQRLCEMGYNVTACDISYDMLSMAEQKCRELENKPSFLCCDMCELELWDKADACVCALDSINYLTDAHKLKKAFKAINRSICAGGLFVFDIKTEAMFEEMSGQSAVWENERLFAAWQYGYDKRSGRAVHIIDIFEKEGGIYHRYGEEHFQRAYPLEKIKEMLALTGFETAGVYKNMKGSRAQREEGRLFIAAIKKREC